MGKGSGYKVIHNGYKIEYFDTPEEVEMYIKSVLDPHIKLSPKKIMDRTLKTPNNNETDEIRIVRYRYYTVYEEDFIIEH